MINIPLDVNVECTDGVCGQSTSLIVNPVTETVTHIVVKAQGIPHLEYMVPLERVVETDSERIQLDCTESEFRQMKQYVVTEFIESDHFMPHYGEDAMMAWPYTIPEQMRVSIEHERIPPGELAVGRGTYVQATDGLVGQVDELLLDPESGHITHLVLREGHLWDKKVLTLPISAIDHTDAENVYLKLDKAAIEALPAIPVQLRPQASKTELIVLAFDELDKAAQALTALKQFAKEESVAILNAAVLIKDKDGQTSMRETADVSPRQGALFGAVTGGLIGLLGGPVGAVVGAVAGAATGRAAAGRIDMGLPDEYLEKLQESLQPGTSALVILVSQKWAEKVSKALADYKGQLLRQTLADETVAQLATQTSEGEADS